MRIKRGIARNTLRCAKLCIHLARKRAIPRLPFVTYHYDSVPFFEYESFYGSIFFNAIHKSFIDSHLIITR